MQHLGIWTALRFGYAWCSSSIWKCVSSVSNKYLVSICIQRYSSYFETGFNIQSEHTQFFYCSVWDDSVFANLNIWYLPLYCLPLCIYTINATLLKTSLHKLFLRSFLQIDHSATTAAVKACFVPSNLLKTSAAWRSSHKTTIFFYANSANFFWSMGIFCTFEIEMWT